MTKTERINKHLEIAEDKLIAEDNFFKELLKHAKKASKSKPKEKASQVQLGMWDNLKKVIQGNRITLFEVERF